MLCNLHVDKLSKTNGPGRVSLAQQAPVLVRDAEPRARVVACSCGCTLKLCNCHLKVAQRSVDVQEHRRQHPRVGRGRLVLREQRQEVAEAFGGPRFERGRGGVGHSAATPVNYYTVSLI